MITPRPSLQAPYTPKETPKDTPEGVLEAIKRGDAAKVQTLMDKAVTEGRKDEFITWAMHDGDWDTGEHNLLHWACDALKLEALAASKPSSKIVETLVKVGISPNSRGQGNSVPLQHISKVNNEEAGKIIRYLLKNGADPNLRNEHGYTPLHEAVDHGSSLAVQLLIDKGANAQILNGQHKSAMDLARQNRSKGINYEEILSCLEKTLEVKDLLNASFHGFFYSGDWNSKPGFPERMQVSNMLQYAKLEKMGNQTTRWFHLPANNKKWIEDLVEAILTADQDRSEISDDADQDRSEAFDDADQDRSEAFDDADQDRSEISDDADQDRSEISDDADQDRSEISDDEYRNRIESEVHAIMEGIGIFSSSTRPARQDRENVVFVSVPLIESDIYVGDDKGLAHRVRERKENMRDLCKMYPDNVFPKKTLDEFYYEALDEKTIVGRDRSQIFSKHSGAVQHMLYVGQLWALRIGENTLITASQGDWAGADISSPARRFAQSHSVRKTPRPKDIFYELQELCVDLVNYHVTGVRCNDQECTMSAREAFTREIAKIANDVKRQYEVYMLPARKVVKRNHMVKMAREIKKEAQSQRITIEERFTCLKAELDNKRKNRPTPDETTEIARPEVKGVNQKIEEFGVLSDKPDLDHEVFEFINQEAIEQHQTVDKKIEELASEPINKDTGRDALDVRDDIFEEAEKLAEIMDVIDELNIINSILEEQYEMARWTMRHTDVRDFVRDVRPSFRALLEESERVRRSIVELLSLRQQEIAIKNAVETALSADEQASTKIAATVFTVVTFIYTPFGFGLTILGSGIVGLSSEYSARTAAMTMLVTLLATVALLVFLLPILTVIKQPWNNWVSWTTRRTEKLLRSSISGRVGLQKDQTHVEGRRASDPKSPQGEKNGGVQIWTRLRRGRFAKDDPEGR